MPQKQTKTANSKAGKTAQSKGVIASGGKGRWPKHKTIGVSVIASAVLVAGFAGYALWNNYSANAAGAWTSIGKQVIKNGNSTATATISACKVKVSGGYQVKAKAVIANAPAISGYQLVVSSNLGSSTTNRLKINTIPKSAATTIVQSKGTAALKSTIRFNTYITQSGGASYAVTPGTTIKEKAITNIANC